MSDTGRSDPDPQTPGATGSTTPTADAHEAHEAPNDAVPAKAEVQAVNEKPEAKEPDKKPERVVQRKKQFRWRLRLLLFLVLLLLLALLLWRQHCLPGKGGGGPASRDGSGQADMSGGGADNAPGQTCTLRVDAQGISVAGKSVPSPEAAVTACGAAKRAHLNVTGDAKFGKLELLQEALRKKGIAVQRQQ